MIFSTSLFNLYWEKKSPWIQGLPSREPEGDSQRSTLFSLSSDRYMKAQVGVDPLRLELPHLSSAECPLTNRWGVCRGGSVAVAVAVSNRWHVTPHFCLFFSISVRFCLFWYWCYYPHTPRYLVSPVCRIWKKYSVLFKNFLLLSIPESLYSRLFKNLSILDHLRMFTLWKILNLFSNSGPFQTVYFLTLSRNAPYRLNRPRGQVSENMTNMTMG